MAPGFDQKGKAVLTDQFSATHYRNGVLNQGGDLKLHFRNFTSVAQKHHKKRHQAGLATASATLINALVTTESVCAS